MAGKARRYCRHLRQSWRCGICKLQILKQAPEFESHSLRQSPSSPESPSACLRLRGSDSQLVASAIPTHDPSDPVNPTARARCPSGDAVRIPDSRSVSSQPIQRRVRHATDSDDGIRDSDDGITVARGLHRAGVPGTPAFAPLHSPPGDRRQQHPASFPLRTPRTYNARWVTSTDGRRRSSSRRPH